MKTTQMEHFRGAKVVAGEQTVLEGVEGHLAMREKSGGRKEWFGYLEVPNDRHIQAGARYRLELADGRQADVNAADIPGSEVPGKPTHPVEFYVCGEVRGAKGGKTGMYATIKHKLG
jgi:hypothetical protein